MLIDGRRIQVGGGSYMENEEGAEIEKKYNNEGVTRTVNRDDHN